jgi:hypothetical protein
MKDMFCKLCRIVTKEKEMLQLERTKAEAEVSYLVQYNRGEGDEGHVLQALQECHKKQEVLQLERTKAKAEVQYSTLYSRGEWR